MEISLYNEMLSDKPVHGRYTKIKTTIAQQLNGTVSFFSSTGISVVTNSKFKIKSEKDEKITIEWIPTLNAWLYNSIPLKT